ncbi:hypothetical protein Csa_006217, partial [Cucumis sativus]
MSHLREIIEVGGEEGGGIGGLGKRLRRRNEEFQSLKTESQPKVIERTGESEIHYI